jgi:hypothetical protein
MYKRGLLPLLSCIAKIDQNGQYIDILQGEQTKRKGRVLWDVLKTENSMDAVFNAIGLMKPEPH